MKITFLFEYPVYAINRTMFFTWMVLVWDFELLCENAVMAFTDIQLVGVICIHSASSVRLQNYAERIKQRKNLQKVRISLKLATATH